MPLIQVNVPEGTLNEDQKDSLIRELTETVLRVEGAPDNRRSRSIAWAFLNEIKKGTWAIGGVSHNSLKYLVHLSVPAGSLNKTRKEQMAQEVYKTLANTSSDTLKPAEAWVIIHEIPDGNWSAGGRIFYLQNIARFVGASPLDERRRDQSQEKS